MNTYERDPDYSYPSEGLYRDTKRKVFTGVCAGIGRHFRINPNWVRLGFIVGFLITAPLPLVVYVVASFIMPKDVTGRSHWQERRQWRKHGQDFFRSHNISRPPRRVSVDDVIAKFDLIEKKVQAMENVVTSREFILKQKFKNL